MGDYKETILDYYQKLLEDLPMLDRGRNFNRYSTRVFNTTPNLIKTFDIDLSRLRGGTIVITVKFLSETEENGYVSREKRSGFVITLYIKKEDKLEDFSVFLENLKDFKIPLTIDCLANSDNDGFYSNDNEIPESDLTSLMEDFSNIVKEVVKELPDDDIYLNADKNYALIDNFFRKYKLIRKSLELVSIP